MFRRIEAEEPRLERSTIDVGAARDTARVAALSTEADRDPNLLPHGRQKWGIDGIAISARAREMAARLKPVVTAVLRFWDHGVRLTLASGRRISIDASGSYRAD